MAKKYLPQLNPPGEIYLTVIEAARKMRITVMTLWKLRKDGKIPTVHIGKRVLIANSSLERFMKENTK